MRSASFGGSWSFLIVFAAFLAAGCSTIPIAPERPSIPIRTFLLNLILSTIAAIQAPIIMMSQKRQETKDRLRSLNDYRVNLKAELEIRHLHEKIDHLLNKQWQRLAEIQQLQLEEMQERRNSRYCEAGAGGGEALSDVFRRRGRHQALRPTRPGNISTRRRQRRAISSAMTSAE